VPAGQPATIRPPSIKLLVALQPRNAAVLPSTFYPDLPEGGQRLSSDLSEGQATQTAAGLRVHQDHCHPLAGRLSLFCPVCLVGLVVSPLPDKCRPSLLVLGAYDYITEF